MGTLLTVKLQPALAKHSRARPTPVVEVPVAANGDLRPDGMISATCSAVIVVDIMAEAPVFETCVF
jgi:hypothetical protein